MPRSHDEAVRVRKVTPGFARYTSVYIRELTRILRVILSDDSVAPLPRQTGTPDQERSKDKGPRRACSGFALLRLLMLTPFNAPSIAGFGGIARRDARRKRVRSRTHTDVRRANPAEAEKRRAPRSFIARCVVGGGVFWLLFFAVEEK